MSKCTLTLADSSVGQRVQVWDSEFKYCIWGLKVLMPDTVLTKLATRARLKTLSDIKNEIPEWQWADEYGEEVLTLLAPIDVAWHEENEQMKAENKAKRARVSAENKAKRYEIQLAQSRQATAKRRAEAAAAASFHRGILQPVAPQYFHPAAPLPAQSQSLPTHYGHQAVPPPMPVPVYPTFSTASYPITSFPHAFYHFAPSVPPLHGLHQTYQQFPLPSMHYSVSPPYPMSVVPPNTCPSFPGGQCP
jgi:hypothetical protein